MKLSHTTTRVALTAVVVFFSLGSSAFAESMTLSSTALSSTVLSPSSDSISFDAATTDFDWSSQPVTFQTGDFIIGNSNIPDQAIPFSFVDTITLNGIAQDVTIFGQDDVTNTTDTLTVFGGSPMMFGDQAFTLQAFNISGYNIGDDVPVDLSATVTPEPASLLLLATAILGGAFLLTKKSRVASSKPTNFGALPPTVT